MLLEKYEVVRGMFHGFDYSKCFTGNLPERLGRHPGRDGAHPRAGGRQRSGT